MVFWFITVVACTSVLEEHHNSLGLKENANSLAIIIKVIVMQHPLLHIHMRLHTQKGQEIFILEFSDLSEIL
jgi:hypothetical protein